MNRTSETPQKGKRLISLTILILCIAVVMTVPIPLILEGRPSDGLAVIYFFPSIFFMTVILASGKMDYRPKLILRVIVLLACIMFVLAFKDVVLNNGIAVALAIAGLIACIVFEYLAAGSVWKKKDAEY